MTNTNFDYDINNPVMVSGATGYVAGWIIQQLLENGVTVHAAVRDKSNIGKIDHLNAMSANLPGTIKFFNSDLLKESSYEEAMAGCSIVFHTASPFTSNVTDPQRDLVDPALIGTKNILNSVNNTPSVDRVVLTSSVAAIYGDAVDLQQIPNQTLTEAIWNNTSSVDHQAYSYSKTVAEKAAWQLANAQARWRLVVINPSFVMGPGTAASQTSESFTVLKQVTDGTMKAGCPPLDFGMVDVRDIAAAHIAAAYLPRAEGRYIVSEKTLSLFDVANILRSEHGNALPLPKKEMPKWLIWLVGPIMNSFLTRKMVNRNMGYSLKVDNSRSVDQLGLKYRPVEEAIKEMYLQLSATAKPV